MAEAVPAGVVSAHSDRDGILIVRVFDAPRELVYRAWTEPERFATWFGEHGSTIPLDEVAMDARPGGAWSAVMYHGPERIRIPFAGHFVEVDPPERVSLTIEVAGDVNATDLAGKAEVLTAVLRDIGDGRTEMTFTQRGGNLPADEYSRAMRGTLIFFDRLADHLASAGPETLKGRH